MTHQASNLMVPPMVISGSAMYRRQRCSITAAVMVLVAATLTATPASAEPPANAASSETAGVASAAELYKSGVACAKSEDWQCAYEAFLSGWKIKEHYQMGAQLARAELKLGKHRDAAEHLARLLKTTKDINAEDRALLQKMLIEAKARIATVTLLVNREGAEVLVDGKAVGVSPLSDDVYVDPGTRTMEARLPGEAPQKVTVELTAGQTRQVGLRFGVKADEEAPPPPAPAEKVGRPLFGGDMRVLVAGSVAAGVGVLSGVAFTLLANDRHKDAKTAKDHGNCTSPAPTTSMCEDAHIDETEGATLTNVAFWSFLGGGIAGAATLIYGLTAPKPSRAEKGARVVPVAVANGGGVLVTGRW